MRQRLLLLSLILTGLGCWPDLSEGQQVGPKCHYYASLTKLGLVGGLKVDHSSQRPVAAFLGIPYAAPPLGLLRLMPPGNWAPSSKNQQQVQWGHYELMPGGRAAPVREQVRSGPRCLRRLAPLTAHVEEQARTSRSLGQQIDLESEDCLTVDVFVPSENLPTHLHIKAQSNNSIVVPPENSSSSINKTNKLASSRRQDFRLKSNNTNQALEASLPPIWPLNGPRLPVLVAFQGVGSGTASTLASRFNSIVVTFNYRIGLLGFLPYFETTSSQSESFSGQLSAQTAPPRNNHAIWDQIALLHWLKRNALSFNGNPHNVSLLALDNQAAQAIQLLLLSPQAKGLFLRVLFMNKASGGNSHDELAQNLTSPSENELESLLRLATQAEPLNRRLVATLSQIVQRLDITGTESSPFAFIQAANSSLLAKIESELEQLASEKLLAFARGPNLADAVLFPQLSALIKAHLTEATTNGLARSIPANQSPPTELKFDLEHLALDASQRQNARSFHWDQAYCSYLRRLISSGSDPLKLLASKPQPPNVIQANQSPVWRNASTGDESIPTKRSQMIAASFWHLSNLVALNQALGGAHSQPSARVAAAHDEQNRDSMLLVDSQSPIFRGGYDSVSGSLRSSENQPRASTPRNQRIGKIGQHLDQILALVGSVDLMFGYLSLSQKFGIDNSESKKIMRLDETQFPNTANKITKIAKYLVSNYPIDENLLSWARLLDFHFLSSAWTQNNAEASGLCDFNASNVNAQTYAFHLDISKEQQQQINPNDWLSGTRLGYDDPLELASDGLQKYVHYGDPAHQTGLDGTQKTRWPSYDVQSRRLESLSSAGSRSGAENDPSQILQIHLDLLPYLQDHFANEAVKSDEQIFKLDDGTSNCLADLEQVLNQTSSSIAESLACLHHAINKYRDRLRRLAINELDRLALGRSVEQGDSRRQTTPLGEETSSNQQQIWPQTFDNSSNDFDREQFLIQNGNINANFAQNSPASTDLAGLLELAHRRTGASALSLIVGAGISIVILNLTVVFLLICRSKQRQQTERIQDMEVNESTDMHEAGGECLPQRDTMDSTARRKSTLRKASCFDHTASANAAVNHQRQLKFDLSPTDCEQEPEESWPSGQYLFVEKPTQTPVDMSHMNPEVLVSNYTQAPPINEGHMVSGNYIGLDFETDLSHPNSPQQTSGFGSSPAANTISGDRSPPMISLQFPDLSQQDYRNSRVVETTQLHQHHPSCQHYTGKQYRVWPVTQFETELTSNSRSLVASNHIHSSKQFHQFERSPSLRNFPLKQNIPVNSDENTRGTISAYEHQQPLELPTLKGDISKADASRSRKAQPQNFSSVKNCVVNYSLQFPPKI